MPPPSVSPAMPVVETAPPVTARPCSCVSRSRSPQVAPPCARTVRPTRVDVNTLHPRQVDHQAAFDHGAPRDIVPAAANRDFQPRPRASLTASTTSATPAALGDQSRPFVHHAVVDTPRVIVARIVGLEQQGRKRAGYLRDALCDG